MMDDPCFIACTMALLEREVFIGIMETMYHLENLLESVNNL